jgi:uncharacterized protein YukE
MSGTILTQTVAVADGTVAIQGAFQQTEQNYNTSHSIIVNNAENFGGQGSQAFQEAIALLQQQYSQQMEAIQKAGHALGLANDGMTQTDMQMAAQYGI